MRRDQIERKELIERELVLIVIKLRPYKAALQAEHQLFRIPITGFKGKLIARDLGNAQALQRSSGEVDDRGIGKGIACGKIHAAGNVELAFKFRSARASAAQVLALASNERRSRAQRHVLNRVHNVAPEKCAA